MELCSSPKTGAHPLLSPVHTPLVPAAWAVALKDHPDRAFVRYLLRGMKEGFRISFRHTAPLRVESHARPLPTYSYPVTTITH